MPARKHDRGEILSMRRFNSPVCIKAAETPLIRKGIQWRLRFKATTNYTPEAVVEELQRTDSPSKLMNCNNSLNKRHFIPEPLTC